MPPLFRVLLLLSIGAQSLWAQESRPVFKRIPSNTGLSQNSILAIIQDRRGFLWVGTSEGVNRYDGYEFVSYRHDPEDFTSLSNDRVLTLFEDRAGSLWVGTLNGANRFDERSGRFERIIAADEAGALGAIEYIVEDANGIVLYSTTIGWCRVQRGQSTCRVVPARDSPEGRPRPQVPVGAPEPTATLETRDGALWLGANELYRYDRVRGVLQQVPLELTGPTELKTVSVIYQDRSGTIWVGTLGGLYKSDPFARDFSHRAHEPYNPETLSGNLVSAIYEDSRGLLWIGTIGGGLTRLDPRTNRVTKFRHDPHVVHSLSNDVIWGLHEDERGGLWVATDDGLNQFDGRSGRFRVIRCPGGGFRGTLPHSVASIAAGGPHVLWVGLFGGALARVDTRMSVCELAISPGLRSGATVVHPDPSGALWGGLEGAGLYRFDPATRKTRHFPLAIDERETHTRRTVWTIHRDRDGSLWLGTDIGLVRFDPSNESLTRFSDPALPSSVVYAIVEDSARRLWFSTNRGICYFDRAAPDGRRFACFGAADGLHNTEFIRRAVLRSRDGRLYFGGLEGLTSFDPARILRRNPIAPPIVLTEADKRSREGSTRINLAGLDAIALSHRDYSFSLAFVALSFTNPTKNQYSYMLEGFDPDWIGPSTRRLAQYTNVPPGTYVFRVRGSNNDGVWNNEGATLRVIITPPFWQRWWFRALIGVAFASALLMVHGYRVRQVLAIERIRRQVATDLHDDVGSGLSQVAILSEVARRDAAPAAAALMSETANLARTMRESLADIVWAVDPRKDRLGDLVFRMRQVAFNALEADGRHVEFRAPADSEIERVGLAADRRRHVLLIFKEAITNIVRHSKATRVSIDLMLRGGALRLTIHDDGRGFDPSRRFDGHGLQSMERRAAELGARLSIESTPGKGTVLLLNVPLG
jgi:signal transduction histidine kinase/ligand-binding sensor domain-containing protein